MDPKLERYEDLEEVPTKESEFGTLDDAGEREIAKRILWKLDTR